jgi:hypothetical protein
MTFTVGVGPQWRKEWPNYLADQRLKVQIFVQTFQTYGLNQTKFPGRISPSWMSLAKGTPAYDYTTKNWLWHYHIGLPHYTPAMGGDVSDWVLHFQWVHPNGKHLDLIELSTHQVMGKFYLPPATSMAATPAPTPAPTPTASP